MGTSDALQRIVEEAEELVRREERRKFFTVGNGVKDVLRERSNRFLVVVMKSDTTKLALQREEYKQRMLRDRGFAQAEFRELKRLYEPVQAGGVWSEFKAAIQAQNVVAYLEIGDRMPLNRDMSEHLQRVRAAGYQTLGELYDAYRVLRSSLNPDDVSTADAIMRIGDAELAELAKLSYHEPVLEVGSYEWQKTQRANLAAADEKVRTASAEVRAASGALLEVQRLYDEEVDRVVADRARLKRDFNRAVARMPELTPEQWMRRVPSLNGLMYKSETVDQVVREMTWPRAQQPPVHLKPQETVFDKAGSIEQHNSIFREAVERRLAEWRALQTTKQTTKWVKRTIREAMDALRAQQDERLKNLKDKVTTTRLDNARGALKAAEFSQHAAYSAARAAARKNMKPSIPQDIVDVRLRSATISSKAVPVAAPPPAPVAARSPPPPPVPPPTPVTAVAPVSAPTDDVLNRVAEEQQQNILDATAVAEESLPYSDNVADDVAVANSFEEDLFESPWAAFT